MTGYADWIREKRDQQKSTSGRWDATSRHRDDDDNPNKGLLPFNRRRIIALAIRDCEYLQRWIDDSNTPPENLTRFKARLPLATINRDRALALQARLPPEWTGPAQPTML